MNSVSAISALTSGPGLLELQKNLVKNDKYLLLELK
jgi:hypothetical protein